MYKITVDLKDVTSAEEIFERFQEVFQFAFYVKDIDDLWEKYGYLNIKSKEYKELIAISEQRGVRRSWDGFNDSFRNLDTDSMLYKKMIAPDKEIHLIIKNADDVKKIPVSEGERLNNEYLTLVDTLVLAANKEERSGSRGDDVNFTFEILNES